MEIINYDTLLEKYAGIAFEKQHRLAEVIGDRDWMVDMNTASISFGDDYKFPMQVIGSYAFDSSTWLWAWANEASNIPEELLIEANVMKELGAQHNIEFLTMPEYKMELSDVHSLGLIASGMFNSSAYYAGNYGSGILLVTLKSDEVDAVNYIEQVKILSVIPQIISSIEVNHRRMIKNYLEAKGYLIAETDNSTIASKEKNYIKIDFDSSNRLTSLNGEIK